MPNIRAAQSGHVFSPEFGGMTANVEFEALTGFSNAFLPIRQHSLSAIYPHATFRRLRRSSAAKAIRRGRCIRSAAGSGTATRSTRISASRSFAREETLPPMEKRGIFASDDSLMKEIMHEADGMDRPFFFFARHPAGTWSL